MAIYSDVLTERFLIDEYTIKRKSSVTISKEVGCKSKTTIINYLNKFNILLREQNETKKGIKQTKEHVKNRMVSRGNFKHTEESKRKIGIKNKEIGYWTGKKRPEHSKAISGKNHPNYTL